MSVTVICPSCGQHLIVHGPTEQRVACPFCGGVFETAVPVATQQITVSTTRTHRYYRPTSGFAVAAFVLGIVSLRVRHPR